MVHGIVSKIFALYFILKVSIFFILKIDNVTTLNKNTLKIHILIKNIKYVLIFIYNIFVPKYFKFTIIYYYYQQYNCLLCQCVLLCKKKLSKSKFIFVTCYTIYIKHQYFLICYYNLEFFSLIY